MRIWPFKYASAGKLTNLLPELGYLSGIAYDRGYGPCLPLNYGATRWVGVFKP